MTDPIKYFPEKYKSKAAYIVYILMVLGVVLGLYKAFFDKPNTGYSVPIISIADGDYVNGNQDKSTHIDNLTKKYYSQNEEKPFLVIYHAPIITKTVNKDSVDIDFSIKEINKSPALNLKTSIIIVFDSSGKILPKKIFEQKDIGSVIYHSDNTVLGLGFHNRFKGGIFSSNNFLCIKILFEDENGKIQKPFKIIYRFSNIDIDSKKDLHLLGETEYKKIDAILKNHKIW